MKFRGCWNLEGVEEQREMLLRDIVHASKNKQKYF